jgi:glutaredoxin
VLAAGLCACRKSTPPSAPQTAETKLPALEVKKDAALLFTYVQPDGNFATTDKAESVPDSARRLVRVIDPGQGAGRRDTDQVYVVDVNELVKAGQAAAKVMSREAFETGALAQLQPGESTPLAGPHGPALEPEPGVDGGTADNQAVVILYGTPWCGACKAARQYLSSKHIPFAYKDIENDAAAARELQAKAARLGIPADRVPILDVRGRLLIGFDRTRLESLLGNPT